VHLYQADRAEPVLFKAGLEFLMHEGRRPREGSAAAALLKTWQFTEEELVTHQMRGPAGWGYAFQLGWGKEVPTFSVITLTARYLPPVGPPVASSPMVIPIPR
jgi:hypothetical protein